MGRGRGKGRKQIIVSRDGTGSGEDDKLFSKRRGRPQKPFKDEMEEVNDEVGKIAGEADAEGEQSKLSTLNGSGKDKTVVENGKKRKRTSNVLENEVDNPEAAKAKPNGSADLMQSAGYRQNGSRRKNKPRRAAEVGVECR